VSKQKNLGDKKMKEKTLTYPLFAILPNNERISYGIDKIKINKKSFIIFYTNGTKKNVRKSVFINNIDLIDFIKNNSK